MKSSLYAIFLLVVACSGNHSFASSGGGMVADRETTSTGLLVGRLSGDGLYERARSGLVLYQNPSNPWVQSAALMTQLQLQYAYGSSRTGKFGTADMPEDLRWGNVEVRRYRVGMRGRLLGDVSFFNLTDLEPDFSNGVYKRFPETYLTWHHSPVLELSAGKCELKFNREQEYASSQFPVFERTAVGNMLYAGELTGMWVSGDQVADAWEYFMGIYSNDRQDEWPKFAGGGAIFLSKIGYDYTPAIGLDQGIVKFQWLHNTQPGYTNSTTNPPSPLYANAFSLSNEIQAGKLGFTAEVLLADGARGRPDVAALSTMTRWSYSKKIELINVLEVAGSRRENGVILPTRYEALAPDLGDRRGDAWFSGYGGVNYYVDGHSVKLMIGVKYGHMDGGTDGGDFSGWTGLTGLRMFF